MKNILWFSEIRKDDIPAVGGKGANLGELSSFNMPVPPGFVVTAKAYFDFLKFGSLEKKIAEELKGTSLKNSEKFLDASKKIKTAILRSSVPRDLAEEIREAYHRLSGTHDVRVAVRSSATAEDLPNASFAGQQETFLNVLGAEDVVEAVRRCWASLFEPRAIFYREDMGFDHFKVGLAAVVQRMIESEVSGIMFTVDPLTNDEEKISIEGAFGLGEPIVAGEITPDQYLVDKKSLKILKKQIVEQEWQKVLKGRVKISREYRRRQKLSDEKITELAGLGREIEEHYGKPQDIEWALSNHKMHIVQARPVTTIKARGQRSDIKTYGDRADVGEIREDEVDEKLILTGIAASAGVATGPVVKVHRPQDIVKVKEGQVLVAKMTSPDYVPAMKKACAIVTDEGGRTSHAAIVSRELGIPCVVGTGQATAILKEGESVTVDGAQGKIYEGKVSLSSTSSRETGSVLSLGGAEDKNPEKSGRIKTATKVYVNLADPDMAKTICEKHVDGVGLLRAEFIMANIGKHPKAFLEEGKEKEFVSRLAREIGKVARAFSPRPVVYRATDFKSNEYRNLKGGAKFEINEENPLIGYRGALRYVTEPEVFQMELKAVKEVRHKMGLNNLYLMIPFCRTVSELKEIKKIIAASGLKHGGSFKIWLMVEIPANVILLDEFVSCGVDGISLGTNDLTMLVLGADRDNAKLAAYSEENEAVLEFIEQAIKTAKRLGITSSMCGEAPSVHPDILKKIVRLGINSVSVDPDVIDSVRQSISREEKELIFSK
ncbi:MAG: phosphoenolpyruvate synthase [Patescibacteria group bacterium]|nr:phosphoenolpyruvate synthase [Patescibacteria group bacterium]